jgi:hypothetical protein
MMSFGQDIQRFKTKTEEKASQIARKVILDLHARIVERTPVDTGRLRANNQVALNGYASGTVPDMDKAGGATMANGEVVVGGYALGDFATINNNLEYATVIEFEGRSNQAPAGFFRVSIADIVNAWPSIVSVSSK